MVKTKTKTENNIASLKELLKSQLPKKKVLTYGEGENKIKITVNPLLPFTQRANMVRRIIDGAFITGDNSINGYIPEFAKIIKRIEIITNYTDFVLPTKLDEAWLVLNYTTIYEDVVNCIQDDINDIFEEADKGINAKVHYLENKTDLNSLFGKLSKTVESFGTQFKEEDIANLLNVFGKLPKNSQDIIQAVLNKTNIEKIKQ